MEIPGRYVGYSGKRIIAFRMRAHLLVSGEYHSSWTESIPHWTVRGFDADGVSVATIHAFPGGDGSRHFPNGGRHWANIHLDITRCQRL